VPVGIGPNNSSTMEAQMEKGDVVMGVPAATVHKTIEITNNPDGSKTTTTTTITRLQDGSHTVAKEVVSEESQTPIENHFSSEPNGSFGLTEQNTPDAEKFGENPLSFLSILLIGLATICGFVSVGKIVRSFQRGNEHWEADADAALHAGGAAIAFALFATPVQFCAAEKFRRGQNSKGNNCLMIASWIMYGIALVNGIALFVSGLQDIEVPAEWVASAVVWNFIGWLLMFLHAEAARTSGNGGSCMCCISNSR